MLFELPTIITEPGEYLTREGAQVTITKTRWSLGQFSCLGCYTGTKVTDMWHCSGRTHASRETVNDIVKKA